MGRSAVRQHLASLLCSLGMTTAGIGFVWFAPLMLSIVSSGSPVPMTTTQSSWLVSSSEFGCFFSSLPATLLSDKVGRKFPVLAIGPLCALTFLLMAYFRSLAVLFVARVLHGVCLGMAFGVCPIYIAEVAEPKQRGSTSCHLMTLYFAGCLYTYCFGPYVSYQAYALVCALPPLIFTATFIRMPESPYYLLMKGKREEAERALSWLRGGKPIDEELKDIEETIQHEFKNKGSWRDLFLTKKDRKAFLIVQICCFTKYMGGITCFINYLSQTLGESTIRFLDHNQLTIVVGVLLTVTSFSSCLIGDKIGRRPMLIYSNLLCFFFYFAIGGYFFVDFKTDLDGTPYVWVLYVSIIGFIFAVNVGLGPLMQSIQAEYFSSRIRGIGGGLTISFSCVYVFLGLKLYQFIQDTVGVHFNYWIYAAVSLWGAICMHIFLPETAGRSLGEIQKDMEE